MDLMMWNPYNSMLQPIRWHGLTSLFLMARGKEVRGVICQFETL